MEWISVNKELPEHGNEVLVALKNKNKPEDNCIFDIAIFYKNIGFIVRRYNWDWVEVKYWKPIDEPKES